MLRSGLIITIDASTVGDERTRPTILSKAQARIRKSALGDARKGGRRAIWVIGLLYAAVEDWLQAHWDSCVPADRVVDLVLGTPRWLLAPCMQLLL